MLQPVERDVPVPPPGNDKYRFYDLEVGDSRLYPYEDCRDRDEFARLVASSARAAARRYGVKFTTRRFNTGLRVWRIE